MGLFYLFIFIIDKTGLFIPSQQHLQLHNNVYIYSMKKGKIKKKLIIKDKKLKIVCWWRRICYCIWCEKVKLLEKICLVSDGIRGQIVIKKPLEPEINCIQRKIKKCWTIMFTGVLNCDFKGNDKPYMEVRLHKTHAQIEVFYRNAVRFRKRIDSKHELSHTWHLWWTVNFDCLNLFFS